MHFLESPGNGRPVWKLLSMLVAGSFFLAAAPTNDGENAWRRLGKTRSDDRVTDSE